MECWYCEKNTNEDSRYCPHCGAILGVEEILDHSYKEGMFLYKVRVAGATFATGFVDDLRVFILEIPESKDREGE